MAYNSLVNLGVGAWNYDQMGDAFDDARGDVKSGYSGAKGELNTAYDTAEQSIGAGYDQARTDATQAYQGALTGSQETLDPYLQYGQQGMAGLQNLGPYTGLPEDFRTDPSYKWVVEQGLQGLERGAAAGPQGLYSGQTMADITNYGQQAASQEYQAAHERGLKEWETNRSLYEPMVEAGLRAGQSMSDIYTRIGTGQADTFSNLAVGRGSDLANLATGRGTNLADMGIAEGATLASLTMSESKNLSNIIASMLGSGNDPTATGTISGIIDDLTQVGGTAKDAWDYFTGGGGANAAAGALGSGASAATLNPASVFGAGTGLAGGTASGAAAVNLAAPAANGLAAAGLDASVIFGADTAAAASSLTNAGLGATQVANAASQAIGTGGGAAGATGGAGGGGGFMSSMGGGAGLATAGIFAVAGGKILYDLFNSSTGEKKFREKMKSLPDEQLPSAAIQMYNTGWEGKYADRDTPRNMGSVGQFWGERDDGTKKRPNQSLNEAGKDRGDRGRQAAVYTLNKLKGEKFEALKQTEYFPQLYNIAVEEFMGTGGMSRLEGYNSERAIKKVLGVESLPPEVAEYTQAKKDLAAAKNAIETAEYQPSLRDTRKQNDATDKLEELRPMLEEWFSSQLGAPNAY